MLALFLALFLHAVADPGAESPAIIPSRAAELPPVWVRADHAIDDRGELTIALGQFRDEVEQYTSAQREGQNRHTTTDAVSGEDAACHGVFLSAPVAERHMSRDTADELVSNARTVLYGRAIASSQGFYFGTPGTLFTVHLDTAVPRPAAPEVYIFFPYARIVRDDRAFCSNPVGTPARPAVGDQFLVFVMTDADDSEGRTYQADAAREMAFQTAGGQLLLPAALQRDPQLAKLTTLEEITHAVLKRRVTPLKPAPNWILKP